MIVTLPFLLPFVAIGLVFNEFHQNKQPQPRFYFLGISL
ncbi:hypothetical protein PULV_a2014 [Pseudoalteromonas ulvae UL12]|nr:hypothetical protein [Pseudoalteromonas ulvae UL12]